MVASLTAVSSFSFAQKVVTTEKTGQLETLIKESERENTPSLKVVGPINGEDIKIIRTMCGRDFNGYESEGMTRTLDLSEALIKQEAGKNYLNEQLGFYNRFYAPSADNEIGIKMFYRCEPLREIILPKTTTVIAGQAFDNCTSLTKCTFFAGLTTIRQYAFRNTKLTNVELPSTLTAMENKVFDGCKELTTVKFTSKAVPTLPDELFSNCPKLKTVIVPEESLEAYKAALKLPEGVTIEGREGITSVRSAASAFPVEVARFDLQGRRLAQPQKGVNIVRYSNGTTAKVVVR
jgi:leucine rich repeat domain protein